jgi:hypothetical protein
LRQGQIIKAILAVAILAIGIALTALPWHDPSRASTRTKLKQVGVSFGKICDLLLIPWQLIIEALATGFEIYLTLEKTSIRLYVQVGASTVLLPATILTFYLHQAEQASDLLVRFLLAFKFAVDWMAFRHEREQERQKSQDETVALSPQDTVRQQAELERLREEALALTNEKRARELADKRKDEQILADQATISHLRAKLQEMEHEAQAARDGAEAEAEEGTPSAVETG